MADLVSVKVTVHGRVTGLGFRAFASAQAKALGLTGYARNLSDESVEIEAEGEREKLEKLITRLKVGPPFSRVQRAEVTWADYKGVHHDFSVRY